MRKVSGVTKPTAQTEDAFEAAVRVVRGEALLQVGRGGEVHPGGGEALKGQKAPALAQRLFGACDDGRRRFPDLRPHLVARGVLLQEGRPPRDLGPERIFRRGGETARRRERRGDREHAERDVPR